MYIIIGKIIQLTNSNENTFRSLFFPRSFSLDGLTLSSAGDRTWSDFTTDLMKKFELMKIGWKNKSEMNWVIKSGVRGWA